MDQRPSIARNGWWSIVLFSQVYSACHKLTTAITVLYSIAAVDITWVAFLEALPKLKPLQAPCFGLCAKWKFAPRCML